MDIPEPDEYRDETTDTPSSPESSHDREIQEYPQLETSPYETRSIILEIGAQYTIPEYFLQPYAKLANSEWVSRITLHDINPDVAHTFIHYLYTGAYETIKHPDPPESRKAIEFQRSVHAYHAARVYEIDGLAHHARRYMEVFDGAVTMCDILVAVREVFSKLPLDQVWLADYVKEKMVEAFEADKDGFKENLRRYGIGTDAVFDPLILGFVLDIYDPDRRASRHAEGQKEGEYDQGAVSVTVSDDYPADVSSPIPPDSEGEHAMSPPVSGHYRDSPPPPADEEPACASVDEAPMEAAPPPCEDVPIYRSWSVSAEAKRKKKKKNETPQWAFTTWHGTAAGLPAPEAPEPEVPPEPEPEPSPDSEMPPEPIPEPEPENPVASWGKADYSSWMSNKPLRTHF
ncbi:hypothetical protein FE257_011431 [Aspergillus nanangensis]|uniref:BTB domain-containing protein n=1 Tax=Aspergillus nanangensis TaxID=2582783 RepID=A0AAD4CHE2_ASPNN|nr:hypothetical protein FE257_011431 [Aspergillus nanangensis]